jgi:hypothetical protein
MTTLDPTTIENLSHAYNRMRAANEQLAFLSFGPTAIIAAQIRASLDEEMAAKAWPLTQTGRRPSAHADRPLRELEGPSRQRH